MRFVRSDHRASRAACVCVTLSLSFSRSDKVIVFDRPGAVFLFNFHQSASYSDYRVGAPSPGKYLIALDSDSPQFGGHARLRPDQEFFTTPGEFNGRPCSLQVYIPTRTCLVLRREN